LSGLIVAGWIVLIAVGLEPDKPLSGGIPGHVDPAQDQMEPPKEGLLGRIGEVAGWVVFGAISLTLPLILVWIFSVHG
jgi:hypothetical protein